MRFTLCFLTLFCSCGLVFGQHDPQRNAVQEIAKGDFEKFEKALKKADAEDPETRFVRMMAATKRGDLEDAVAHGQAALDAGMPFARFVAGPRQILAPLRKTKAWEKWSAEHGGDELLLLHGPMLGAVTDSAASIWVRTAQPSKVQVRIDGRTTDPVETSESSDLTAVVRVEGLTASTESGYEVLVDGQVAASASLNTCPAPGKPAKFKVAFGGGAGFVPKWEYMWDTIGKNAPAALLLLGDNVYIDQPEFRLCHDYCYYRRQARSEWRKLIGNTPVYAIYDDHDFGVNDCVPGPEIESPPWKREVWNIFRQNWANPSYGGGDAQPGCWFDFHIGDVHFILLDGRYYRDRENGSMLGPVQKAWLKKTLGESKSTFKVLASPVPFTAGIKPGSKDPWDGYPDEREEIFSFIGEKKIEGVFLIAADRHRTDLRTTERPEGYTLYEFESSRLTNRHTHGVIKTPGLVWGFNETCSFGLMRFDTTLADPEVTFVCKTIDGKTEEEFTLKRSQLRF